MLMIKPKHISDTSLNFVGLHHPNPHYTTLLHIIPSPPHFPSFSNLNGKQAFRPLSCSPRLPKSDHKKPPRELAIYSGVDPAGVPPSGPPNLLSWIVGVAIAVVVPLISYRWGPTLKNKIAIVFQVTEDVAEAVEKVAEEVEKMAEDISDNLPAGGKFKEAVDYVENFAERVAKDAGAVDDFIDKIQDQQEKTEKSFSVESVRDNDKSNGDNASHYSRDEDESNGQDTTDQGDQK